MAQEAIGNPVPKAKMYNAEELGYVEDPTPKQCNTCVFFQSPNVCTFPLDMPVHPVNGCCNMWKPRPDEISELYPETSYAGDTGSGYAIKEEQALGTRNDIREEDVDPAPSTAKKATMVDVLQWRNDENVSQMQHAIDPNKHYDWSLSWSAKDPKEMSQQELFELVRAYAFRHQEEDVSDIAGYDASPEKPSSWWNFYNDSMKRHMIDPHELYPEGGQIQALSYEQQDPKGRLLIDITHKIRRGGHVGTNTNETQEQYHGVEPQAEQLEGMYLNMAKKALDAAVVTHTASGGKHTLEGLEDDMIRKALKFLNMAFIAHKEELRTPAMGLGGGAPTGGGIPAQGQTGELKPIQEEHYMGRNVFPDLILRVNNVYNTLKARGIPEPEIQRAIMSEFAWGSHYWQQWPPMKTGGFDVVDKLDTNYIPAPSYPPYDGKTERNQYTGMDKVAVPEEVSIPSSLSNISVGGGPRPHEESVPFTTPGAVHSGGANRNVDDPADVYMGLAANTVGPQPMRQDPTYNSREMPEELYYPRWRKAEFEGQPVSQIPETFVVKEAKEKKLAKYRYNGHEEGSEICKKFDGQIFDLNETSGRPVPPSENSLYTNTHPNCKCTWDAVSAFENEATPDVLLSSDGQDHISHVNRIIGQKARHGTLHPLNSDGSVSDDTFGYHYNPRHQETKKIQESLNELRQQFKWLTPRYIEKIHKQKWGDGKFLLIRAAGEIITDHRAEGEPYPRLLSANELHGMARTAVGKGMDINHSPAYRTNAVIMDSEFDPDRKEIQMLVYETDPEVLRAVANGTINAVSINGGPPRSEEVGKCDAGSCLIPKGVILGETDGIALTYVVTDPGGMPYHGTTIPPAEPGIKSTSLEIL